jgi:Icc-related predicted phosphoesterase
MRIAWSSDLHADVSDRNAALLAHLSAHVDALAPDVFVVAGDVAETVSGVQDALHAFANLSCARVYVPGNHDLFAEQDAGGAIIDSRRKMQQLLPQAVDAAGFAYLGLQPVTIQSTTFIGTCGWFDGTHADPQLASVMHRKHFTTGAWRHQRAFDKGHVLWPSDSADGGMPCSLDGRWAADDAISQAMLQSLREQVQQADAQARIVGVVHVLPFPESVQRQAFGSSSFHDAWLGSTRLGDCLREDARVRLVISGHLHRALDIQVTPRLRAVASPIGDARHSHLPLPELARQRIGCIELPEG